MRRLAAVLAASLAVPAAAVAQEGEPAPVPEPAPAPTSTPAPEPPDGTIQLVVERAGGDRAPVAARGGTLRIRGIVKPYVAGQSVTVRIGRGDSPLLTRRVAVRRPAGAKAGQFVLRYTPRRPGRIRIRASHAATAQQGTIVAPERTVPVVDPVARPGARGPAVRLLQRLLDARGYVIGRRGVMDARTARAVHAFRTVSRLPRTYAASPVVFRRLLAGGGEFRVRYPGHGRHVEADLSRQVVALIDRGRVQRIYPTSTGARATPTVRGSFRVYRFEPGTNAKGMVHSVYFIRGYALHGYKSVPPYPASAGCLRLPIPDARTVYDWLDIGDRVDVYYRNPREAPPARPNPNPGP